MGSEGATMQGGDDVRGDDAADTVARLLEDAQASEAPDPGLCLKLARAYEERGDVDQAFSWVIRVVDGAETFRAWTSAASLLRRLRAHGRPPARRTARVAMTSSYTTSQLAAMIELGALRFGVDVELYEGDFGQYRQDLIDPASALYAHEPEDVIIATHEGALELPRFSRAPEDDVAAELDRWRSLWQLVAERSEARVVQHNFVSRPETPFGHYTSRLPGSRHAMIDNLNVALARSAPPYVSLVEADRLAALYGKARWFDDRYWHLAKQAVALDALPSLARHSAAVLAAAHGLARKCIVLDLDNTLWGGVVGEDGLAGIELGGTASGEAYLAFQEYLLELKNRGVILAVASKNNERDAREVFERHPEMRLRLDDIALFVANWDDKVANLRLIAETLSIGLDALVLVDDNPAERQIVRQHLPEVEVPALPADPSHYVRTLSSSLLFEPASITAEDEARTEQYRARAKIAQLETTAESLADFYRSLGMEAIVAPFDELHLPRIVQLIGKTNQFNLTTRRHNEAQVKAFMESPRHVHLYLRLRDRFADHGLVSIVIAEARDDVLDIDTWLMSCRVIGRTVEAELLKHLGAAAEERGCSRIRGTYIPTPKNIVARDVYERFGFELVADEDGTTTWEYDIAAQGPPENEFIGTWEGAGVG